MATLDINYHIHYCNINGIRSKKNDITAILHRFPSTGLLSFVETKINSDTDAPKLPSFITHALPFSPTSSGIIHYSHSTTQYRNLRRLAQIKCKDGSMALFCQVCINGLVFNFGSVYIRPQAPADVCDQVLTHLDRVASLPFPL